MQLSVSLSVRLFPAEPLLLPVISTVALHIHLSEGCDTLLVTALLCAILIYKTDILYNFRHANIRRASVENRLTKHSMTLVKYYGQSTWRSKTGTLI
jgi:hypothetical protein